MEGEQGFSLVGGSDWVVGLERIGTVWNSGVGEMNMETGIVAVEGKAVSIENVKN